MDNEKNLSIKQILLLAFTAFMLHLIWENAQAPLFAGYVSFGQNLPICFLGTIGDVVFTLLVYLGIGLLKNDFGWIMRLNRKDIAVIAALGFLGAIAIEWRALLFGRWGYTDAMPIIPYVQVGLTPILQMTLLLPLSFYVTSKLHSPRYIRTGKPVRMYP